MKNLFIDFETFSSVDIKKAGSYKYMESDDFEILLAAYAFDDGDVTVIDLVEDPQGARKFDKLFSNLDDVQIVAHNATFERTALKAYGYDIPTSKFYCTANKALYCGLPATLAGCSDVLSLPHGKLGTGKDLIRYFSVPCKPTKANGGRERNMPTDDPQKWEDFKTYLIYDVLAERELYNKLAVFAFPESERRIYEADQRINDYGILVDLNLAEKAQEFDAEYKEELSETILNKYGIENLKSIPSLKKFIQERTGLQVSTLDKKSMDDLIANINKIVIPESDRAAALEVINARREIGKTSNAKYSAILASAGDDNRVRGLFRYYGASRTGRWAGRLVQLQNLPQNHIEELQEARDMVSHGTLHEMQKVYDKPTHILSQLIRTTFVAPEGMTYSVADFSAIEARVIAWVANEDWRLELFADPTSDIYCASASKMFGVPVHKGDELRQRGKVAELALGYGGGVNALTVMDTKGAIKDDEKQGIVDKWRSANGNIVGLWKTFENAAKQAIKTRRAITYSITSKACIVFEVRKGFLTVKLPSGRELFYPKPRLETKAIAKGNGDTFEVESITYYGMEQTTNQWTKLHTYGGKLTENIIQAISRDLLANAIFEVFKLGFNIVLHVHDEIAAEIPLDGKEDETLEVMSNAMCKAPDWAEGIPLRAAGYITPFYKKD